MYCICLSKYFKNKDKMYMYSHGQKGSNTFFSTIFRISKNFQSAIHYLSLRVTTVMTVVNVIPNRSVGTMVGEIKKHILCAAKKYQIRHHKIKI